VEFIVKLKKGDSLKICSKRYSDLHQFHQTLSEQNLIDRSKAPVYPDKQVGRRAAVASSCFVSPWCHRPPVPRITHCGTARAAWANRCAVSRCRL
jgi:hypothetical protein